ncbi:GNAT family N-acetyltransferase [Caballeronia sp. LZ043]|uniref:GNAT family N-acetyltransferase n=1 Tax=Caballeronia sp. LZ043 TaxID=3038569 RepID=UPI002854ABCA|nr:GNAT family N-acetyltransferase [Caballeronia sp. LZ043]MDR5823624.1 GNAT family N-acetyltransferase [Caballeronia sp. LZ043]
MTESLTFVHLEEPAEIYAAFDLMKQLRTHLRDPDAFVAQIKHQHQQGYRLLAARSGSELLGLSGYRTQSNLLYGSFIYVDDLVVDSSQQRGGIGAQLLQATREIARKAGCAFFVLDTGLHMALAQRFYFRQGLLARGMHFSQQLPLP